MPAERIALSALLEPENPAPLEQVRSRIAAGEVFVYPTETVYGIGGRFDGIEVYSRILAAKKRRPEQAMILIAADFAAFSPLSPVFPPAAEKLAGAFWPGMLTLVVPTKNSPDGVAVRVSGHPFLQALRPRCSHPLFSTSANISGEPYDPSTDAIYATFKESVDFMIDAGELPPSAPSTVVKVTGDNAVTVLREGSVSAERIFAVCKG